MSAMGSKELMGYRLRLNLRREKVRSLPEPKMCRVHKKAETAVVWKLHPDKTMEPVKVSLGITDHAYTEVSSVLKGELKESDDVIIRSVVPKGQTLGGIRP